MQQEIPLAPEIHSEGPNPHYSFQTVSEFQLPSTWIKFSIIEGFPVYYDYRFNNFSFSPVFDSLTFISLMNSHLSKKENDKNLISLDDLNKKIKGLVETLKIKNGGKMFSDQEMNKTDLAFQVNCLLTN